MYIATPEKGAGPGLVVIPARRDGARAASDICDSFAAEGNAPGGHPVQAV
jgi:hypothetical protein